MRGCTLHCSHPWNTQDTTGQCQWANFVCITIMLCYFQTFESTPTHSLMHTRHARTHTHSHAHTHMACTHTHTHARVHAHTRVCTHTHTHTQCIQVHICLNTVKDWSPYFVQTASSLSILYYTWIYTPHLNSHTQSVLFLFSFFPFSLNATDFTSHMPPCSSQLAQCSIPHIPSQCSKTMYTYQKGKRRLGAWSIPPSSLHPPKHIFIIKVSRKQYHYL